MEIDTIIVGESLDVMAEMPDGCVDLVITSPSYWGIRDLAIRGQVGIEKTPKEYVNRLVRIFDEVWRILRDDRAAWLNLGDSYASNWGMGARRQSSWWSTKSGDLEGKGWGDVETAIPPNSFRSGGGGLKVKDLAGIPWQVAFALQSQGWWIRSEIIWHKPNSTSRIIEDRPMRIHEHIFVLVKNQRYFYNQDAVEAQYRRTVWSIPTQSFDGHSSTFPEELAKLCVKIGTRIGDIVFDPFMGSGTTAVAALKLGRHFYGCDINPEYVELANRRIEKTRLEMSQLSFLSEQKRTK